MDELAALFAASPSNYELAPLPGESQDDDEWILRLVLSSFKKRSTGCLKS